MLARSWFTLALGSLVVLTGGCRADDTPGDELGSSETNGDGDGDGDGLLEPTVSLASPGLAAIDPTSEPVPLGVRVSIRFDRAVASADQAAVAAELGLLDASETPVPVRAEWSPDGDALTLVPRGLLEPQTRYRLRTGAASGTLDDPRVAASETEFTTKLRSDFDGDGFADLVIAAPGRAQGGAAAAGAVMVHPGSAQGIGASPSLTLTGAGEQEETYGNSHAAVDLDGDGYDDLVIGAPGRSGFAGAVEIRYGSAQGLSPTPDQVLDGPVPSELFGARVAGVGDLDGDGFEDLAIGAPRADLAGLTDAGRVQVHLGGADGIATSPELALVGDGQNAELGEWMTAGDFNDDGFDDLVACAPLRDLHRGAALILPGGPDGPAVAPALILVGENVQDAFCTHPAVADVDGDGVDDLVVGVAGWIEGVGAVAVYPGGIAGAATGLDPAVFDRLLGDAQPDLFGFVVDAGDLDDDGDHELLIGAPFASAGARDGAAYLHLGGPQGSAQIPAATWTGTGAELFGLTYPPLDLDGDGDPEAIIAAPGYASLTGRVLIYAGDASGFAGAPAVILEGASPGERFGDYLPLS